MKLVLVYNAEAGIFHGLMDMAHKIISPDTYDCQLCLVTYGLTGMIGTWRDFLASLPLPSVFHHRKDFHAVYGLPDMPLPVVLLDRDGEITTLLDAETLKACDTLDALIDALRQQLVCHDVLDGQPV